jgi:hypothetical protein
MSPTSLGTRPTRAGSRAPLIALIVAGALAVVVLVRVASIAMEQPDFVDRVTIVNETPYGVDVDVRPSDDAGRLLLGRALPGASADKKIVIDAGDRWIFRFVRAGVEGGEVELSRAQLEAADWTVRVPDSVETAFGQAGQEPYPQEGSR